MDSNFKPTEQEDLFDGLDDVKELTLEELEELEELGTELFDTDIDGDDFMEDDNCIEFNDMADENSQFIGFDDLELDIDTVDGEPSEEDEDEFIDI